MNTIGRKIICGYCKQQSSDYSISVNIISSDTNESSEKYYGTYDCKYKRSGNKCNQYVCSVLASNNICIGSKI